MLPQTPAFGRSLSLAFILMSFPYEDKSSSFSGQLGRKTLQVYPLMLSHLSLLEAGPCSTCKPLGEMCQGPWILVVGRE